MTPDQKAVFETITGLIQRTAMEIAEFPGNQRAAALQRGRNAIVRIIVEPELVEICMCGIATVLRDIDASGNRSGDMRRISRKAAFRLASANHTTSLFFVT